MKTDKDMDEQQQQRRLDPSTSLECSGTGSTSSSTGRVDVEHVIPGGKSLMMTRLGGPILAWTSLVVVAVLAAAYTSSLTDDDNDLSDNANTLQRWLWNANDSDSQEMHLEHQHHPVYNEEHKPLLPLSTRDFWGFDLAVLGLMVAAGGGIGGGGILVPIYILVLGFTPKHAIPLSNVTVLGGAIANTLLNTRKRHPLANRPLVDWDLILVMEPLTIAGALLGAFLNKLLPELLLTVLLVLLLSVTSYTSLTKAVKLYKKESKQMAMRAAKEEQSELTFMAQQERENDQDAQQGLLGDNDVLDDTRLIDSDTDLDHDDHGNTDKRLSSEMIAQRDQILYEEQSTPSMNVTILVTMFIVVLAINVLKGGGAFPSPLGIQCGSKSFWMANIIMLAWIFVISFGVRQYLVQRWRTKARVAYPYMEGDIQWTPRNTLVYPLVCCLAGFFAGMFGVGGGIVKGPLMLAMGVHPTVSSASSACMILFTSFTATTSFVVFGLLVPDYALVGLVVGFAATLVGQVGLGMLMRKNERNSYIAFSIGFVVLLSAFLMTIQSLLSMAEGEHHHSGGICGAGD